ncbi:unannotated protein [freshwater metagenome]|uniref:Unannotated protein n=1 Tax=freshwater metagenome TaxID=449393 RepID=A0A6J7GBJ1_9ZZZZ
MMGKFGKARPISSVKRSIPLDARNILSPPHEEHLQSSITFLHNEHSGRASAELRVKRPPQSHNPILRHLEHRIAFP